METGAYYDDPLYIVIWDTGLGLSFLDLDLRPSESFLNEELSVYTRLDIFDLIYSFELIIFGFPPNLSLKEFKVAWF